MGNRHFFSDCVHIQVIICTAIKQSELHWWTASWFYFTLCLKSIDDCNLFLLNLRKIAIRRRAGSFNCVFIEYFMIYIVVESWWSFITPSLLLSHINEALIIWCCERSLIQERKTCLSPKEWLSPHDIFYHLTVISRLFFKLSLKL